MFRMLCLCCEWQVFFTNAITKVEPPSCRVANSHLRNLPSFNATRSLSASGASASYSGTRSESMSRSPSDSSPFCIPSSSAPKRLYLRFETDIYSYIRRFTPLLSIIMIYYCFLSLFSNDITYHATPCVVLTFLLVRNACPNELRFVASLTSPMR